MSQNTLKAFHVVKAKQQQHHVGKTIKTSVFGRMVEGRIFAIHPFGVVDIQLSNGNCYRVSGLSLS